jgi:hypothetical protein
VKKPLIRKTEKANPLGLAFQNVRSERLELSHLAELPPEDSASTNFATSAVGAKKPRHPKEERPFDGTKIRARFTPTQHLPHFFR